jgi:hypothetical protein
MYNEMLDVVVILPAPLPCIASGTNWHHFWLQKEDLPSCYQPCFNPLTDTMEAQIPGPKVSEPPFQQR